MGVGGLQKYISAFMENRYLLGYESALCISDVLTKKRRVRIMGIYPSRRNALMQLRYVMRTCGVYR